MQMIIDWTKENLSQIKLALLGSLFIALCSIFPIPVKPVPFSLQTMAIFMIALTQSPKVAFLSTIFYLTEATLGMPVLAKELVNPLWFIGKTAGYLFSFPIAAYVISYLSSKYPSTIFKVFSLLLGQAIIFLCGFGYLSLFIGVSLAFQYGVVIFIPTAIFKIGLAIGFHELYLLGNKK